MALRTAEEWMKEALKEAQKGIGISNPNPAVGCILVDTEGVEITRGFTEKYGGLHAEGMALKRVLESHQEQRLQGASLYVTLEPCAHFGHQPPCSEQIARFPFKKIFIGIEDPNPKVKGRGIEELRQSKKEVEVGLLEKEITLWHFPFLFQQKKQRPFIALKWAQTLDGQLADDEDHSQWISNQESQQYAHYLRLRSDAILVGVKTFFQDKPKLSVRDCGHFLHYPASDHPRLQPIPIVFDPYGIGTQLSASQKVQEECHQKTFLSDQIPFIWVGTQKHPVPEWIQKKTEGLSLHLNDTCDPIEELVRYLKSEKCTFWLKRPFQSLLVEGGPKTLLAFLKAGYGDLLHILIAPKITGGYLNRIYLERQLHQAALFEQISSNHFGEDTLIELIPIQNN